MSGLGLPQSPFSVSGLFLLDGGIQFPVLFRDDNLYSFLFGPKPLLQLFLYINFWLILLVLGSFVWCWLQLLAVLDQEVAETDLMGIGMRRGRSLELFFVVLALLPIFLGIKCFLFLPELLVFLLLLQFPLLDLSGPLDVLYQLLLLLVFLQSFVIPVLLLGLILPQGQYFFLVLPSLLVLRGVFHLLSLLQ